MCAAGVIATRRIDRVILEHALHAARIVHGDFQALHVHDILLALLAQAPRSSQSTVREQSAERAFAPGNQVDHLQHGRTVAPVQLDATRVFGREQTTVEALHGPGDGPAEGHRVDTHLVQSLVEQHHHWQVADGQIGADRADRLVFGSTKFGQEVHRFVLDALFAAHRARVAAIHLEAIRLGDRLGVDGVDLVGIPLAILEVAHDHVAFQVLADNAGAGTEVVEVVVNVFHRLGNPLGRGLQGLGVGDGYLLGAAHGDRFQVLRPHDGAHAASTGNLVQIVHNQGKAHQVFASDPCLSNLQQSFAVLGAQCVLDRGCFQTPDRGSIPHFDMVVFDPQIDRFFGAPVEDDGIPAGVPQLSPPEATGLGLAKEASHRRLRADGVPPGAREGRARQHPSREDEHIVWAQRIGPNRHFGEQIVGDERPSAQVATPECLAEGLDSGRASAEIDVKNAVPVAIRHQLVVLSKVLTARNRRHEINSRSVGQDIVEIGGLAIDANDDPTLCGEVKAGQDVGDTCAGRVLPPHGSAGRIWRIAQQPTVQVHLNAQRHIW